MSFTPYNLQCLRGVELSASRSRPFIHHNVMPDVPSSSSQHEVLPFAQEIANELSVKHQNLWKEDLQGCVSKFVADIEIASSVRQSLMLNEFATLVSRKVKSSDFIVGPSVNGNGNMSSGHRHGLSLDGSEVSRRSVRSHIVGTDVGNSNGADERNLHQHSRSIDITQDNVRSNAESALHVAEANENASVPIPSPVRNMVVGSGSASRAIFDSEVSNVGSKSPSVEVREHESPRVQVPLVRGHVGSLGNEFHGDESHHIDSMIDIATGSGHVGAPGNSFHGDDPDQVNAGIDIAIGFGNVESHALNDQDTNVVFPEVSASTASISAEEIVAPFSAPSTGPSTYTKKTRKKRKAKDSTCVEELDSLFVDTEVEDFYTKYLRTRVSNLISKKFIDIDGFPATYKQFYDSFKGRGEIDDAVMNAFIQVFNSSPECIYKSKVSRTKFCFTTYFIYKLLVNTQSFKDGCLIKEFDRLNELVNFAKIDSIFLPIIKDHHWAVLCINNLFSPVNFFDSANIFAGGIQNAVIQNMMMRASLALYHLLQKLFKTNLLTCVLVQSLELVPS